MSHINVADYRVVKDNIVKLTHSGDSVEAFEFNVPDDLPENSAGCVWWVDRKTGSGAHVDYVVKLNGDDIRPAAPHFYRVSEPFFYSRHETFSAARLKAGKKNTLKIEVVGGGGTLEMSDFIVAYKRRIDV